MTIELPSDLAEILDVHAKAQNASVHEMVVAVLWTCHDLDLLKSAMRVGPHSSEQWGTFTPKGVDAQA